MSTKPENKRRRKKAQKKKSVLREWGDSILFAVVAATLIRWLFIEAYMIPTPSMENSLLVGDYLFVSKMHYGARTPETPLQVPLTFQKIWGTDIPSYLDWIKLPMYRLPGFSEVKRFDPVVFNYPHDGLDQRKEIPTDIRTYYIKRCIGLPGDKLAVKDKQVYIDGEAIDNPEGLQTSYLILSNTKLMEERVFINNGIRLYNINPQTGLPSALRNITQDSVNNLIYHYVVHSTADKIEKLKDKSKYSFLISIQEITETTETTGLHGEFKRYHRHWTYDNFGEITIPKEGMTIELNEVNTSDYQHVIVNYEYNDNAEYKDGKIYIDGEVISSYTFKQDYYFMMGDNRHNSADSRAWGFVPADHVVGKALFTWWSVNSFAGWGEGGKVRWDRVFRLID